MSEFYNLSSFKMTPKAFSRSYESAHILETVNLRKTHNFGGYQVQMHLVSAWYTNALMHGIEYNLAHL